MYHNDTSDKYVKKRFDKEFKTVKLQLIEESQ